ILDQSRWRLKTGKAYVVDLLREKEAAVGDPKLFLANAMHAAGYDAVQEKDLAVRCGLRVEESQRIVGELVAAGEVTKASRAGFLLSARRLREARAEALRAAEAFF